MSSKLSSQTNPSQQVSITTPSATTPITDTAEGINITTSQPDNTTGSDIDFKQEPDAASKLSYFIGAGFVLLASWAFAFQNYWVKKASEAGFRSFQSLLGRGLIQMLFTGLIDLYDIYVAKGANTKSPVDDEPNDKQQQRNLAPQNKKDWIYIVLVGFLGFMVAYFNYSGTELLPQGMVLMGTFNARFDGNSWMMHRRCCIIICNFPDLDGISCSHFSEGTNSILSFHRDDFGGDWDFTHRQTKLSGTLSIRDWNYGA